MSTRQIRRFLLLTSAFGAAALVASAVGAVSKDESVSDLFDPGAIAAGVCGGSAKHATTFKPMQLALVSPAEGVAADSAGPPLWEGFGTLGYKITSDNDLAQRYFDQGLRLTYAFNHAEAYRAFKKAQALDPGCAMCFWGEAFVLGANINAPMEGSAAQPAFLAMTNANARAANASERERALIDALAKRYASDPAADQAALAQAYADAMAALHAQYPDDQDVAVLFAELGDEHLAMGLLGGRWPHAQRASGRSDRRD